MFSRISKAVAIQKWLPVVPLQRISIQEQDFGLVRMASCKKPEKKPEKKCEKKPEKKCEKKPAKKQCQKPEKKQEKKCEKKPEKKCEKKPEKKCEKKPEPKVEEKKKRPRVTIVGGCGKVGSTLALLLKQSPWIGTLAMYDIVKQNCGISMDLSHIDTRCRIQAYTGEGQISDALKEANIVLICAGEPRKPDMCIDDLFDCNATNIKCIAERVAACSPKAFLGILTQPINSIVPMVCEVLKSKGVFDPKKVFGISSVNVVRATTFVAEALNLDPANVIVPVVGGHTENTLVPILSQTKPCSKLEGQETCEIIRLVKKSAGWVFEMKDRKEAAVLGPAYAAARFTNNLLRAMEGQPGVFECAYVHTTSVPGITYCTMPVELGPEGIKLSRLPKMCDHEMRIFQDATCELGIEIKRGEEFITKKKKC